MTQIDLVLKTTARTIRRKYMSDAPIDWEQRRYEIARDIMAAAYVMCDNRGMKFRDMAFDAVRVADALIDELKIGE